MPRPKQPSSTEKHHPESLAPSGLTPKWKWKVLGFLGLLLFLSALWTSGLFKELTAGPKTPLPREASAFSLGMAKADLIAKYPSLKKKLRPFNNDPVFQIATLDQKSGITGASTVDLLFFHDQLYFISSMFETEAAKAAPFDAWVKQYRRWNKAAGDNAESLGAQVLLKEWHFADGKTEMTLRDLNYPDHLQRWEDLRDATNEAAQQAFMKYRLDASN